MQENQTIIKYPSNASEVENEKGIIGGGWGERQDWSFKRFNPIMGLTEGFPGSTIQLTSKGCDGISQRRYEAGHLVAVAHRRAVTAVLKENTPNTRGSPRREDSLPPGRAKEITLQKEAEKGAWIPARGRLCLVMRLSCETRAVCPCGRGAGILKSHNPLGQPLSTRVIPPQEPLGNV